MKFIRDVIGEKRERSLRSGRTGEDVSHKADSTDPGELHSGFGAASPEREPDEIKATTLFQDSVLLSQEQRIDLPEDEFLISPIGKPGSEIVPDPEEAPDSRAAHAEGSASEIADAPITDLGDDLDPSSDDEEVVGTEPPEPTDSDFDDLDFSNLTETPEVETDAPSASPFRLFKANQDKAEAPAEENPAMTRAHQIDKVMQASPTPARPVMGSHPRMPETEESSKDTSSDEQIRMPEPDPAPIESVAPAAPVDVPAPALGRGSARAGRVKTRLLGFSPTQVGQSDPFAQGTQSQNGEYTSFPVGWLVVVNGPGKGAAFTLFNGVSMIGRGDNQTVRLDFGDNSISRENHAAIAFDPEQSEFFIGHGGKANLVRRNNRPVLATEELGAGDLIRIGETTLRFVPLCGPDFSWNEAHAEHSENVSFA